MAATSILSTDAEMLAMAGENVDATGFTDANKTAWGIQAEAYLNALAGYDWVTNVASLAAKTAALLSEYVARYVAVAAIQYNMEGFGTDEGLARIHAEDMMGIHLFRMDKIEQLVKDGKLETFMLK